MTTDDYRWILMTTDDYQWQPMTKNEYQWLPMTTNDYQWLPITTNKNQWLPMNTNRNQWLTMTINDNFSWTMASFLVCFLGPEILVWAQKSDFCHATQILVDGPFVALRETVHFPHWERFFDFSFLSYGRFRKKNKQKKQLTRQKVFPLPTVRALSASNSPSALSAWAGFIW